MMPDMNVKDLVTNEDKIALGSIVYSMVEKILM